MSASAPAATDLPMLRDLYARYKALVSAAAACVTLGQPLAHLRDAAEALDSEARSAADCDSPLAMPFSVCAAATCDLVRLIGAAPGDEMSGQLATTRATHRALRRQIWDVAECEYVPCCVPALESPTRGGR